MASPHLIETEPDREDFGIGGPASSNNYGHCHSVPPSDDEAAAGKPDSVGQQEGDQCNTNTQKNAKVRPDKLLDFKDNRPLRIFKESKQEELSLDHSLDTEVGADRRDGKVSQAESGIRAEQPSPGPAHDAQPSPGTGGGDQHSYYANELDVVWKSSIPDLEARIGECKLDGTSLGSLKPKGRLSEEVLNGHLELGVRKSKMTAAVIKCRFMTKIMDVPSVVALLRPEFDFTNYDVVVGAIWENKCHWTLWVVKPQEQRVIYINPLGESPDRSEQYLRKWRAFMLKRYELGTSPQTDYKMQPIEHVKQLDDDSCGVFVLKFAECYLFADPLDTVTNHRDFVKKYRRDIALALLQGSDDLSDYCRKCSMRQPAQLNTPIHWVHCDYCKRRFHAFCLGMTVQADMAAVPFQCERCIAPAVN